MAPKCKGKRMCNHDVLEMQAFANVAEWFLGCNLDLKLGLAWEPRTSAELVLPIGETLDVVPYVQELTGDGERWAT